MVLEEGKFADDIADGQHSPCHLNHTPRAGKTPGRKEKTTVESESSLDLLTVPFELWISTPKLTFHLFRLLMVLVQFSNTSSEREAFSKTPKGCTCRLYVLAPAWRLLNCSPCARQGFQDFDPLLIIRHRAILLFFLLVLHPRPLPEQYVSSLRGPRRTYTRWDVR